MAERNLDFDRVIDRRGSDCLKYDFAKQRGMPEDILPLWVADMDFKTSSYVEDALAERGQYGIFGYSEVQKGYFDLVHGWITKHHGWDVRQSWLVKTPGVVFALAMSVKAYTEPGDAVLIQQPVYYPFSEVIRDNGRRIVSNDLRLGDDSRYHIDFDDFENKIVSEQIKLFLLCNPHNPVGRVWTDEELLRLGDICLKHGVIVVSDEIHADFVFKGKHSVFASLREEFNDISVVCTSPSKTFNLAGCLISNIFIPDHSNRARFRKQVDAAGISQLSIFGLVACEAAYAHGEEWYRAMMSYVAENIAFTQRYVEEEFPGVRTMDHEGTYLLWLDFRGTGLDPDTLDDLIIHRAKVWLDSGRIFGECGRGFQRINVACPRSVLAEALARIRHALYE